MSSSSRRHRECGPLDLPTRERGRQKRTKIIATRRVPAKREFSLWEQSRLIGLGGRLNEKAARTMTGHRQQESRLLCQWCARRRHTTETERPSYCSGLFRGKTRICAPLVENRACPCKSRGRPGSWAPSAVGIPVSSRWGRDRLNEPVGEALSIEARKDPCSTLLAVDVERGPPTTLSHCGLITSCCP